MTKLKNDQLIWEIKELTSRLKSWPACFLCTRTFLSENPRDQLALSPFVGFPPESKSVQQDHISTSTSTESVMTPTHSAAAWRTEWAVSTPPANDSRSSTDCWPSFLDEIGILSPNNAVCRVKCTNTLLQWCQPVRQTERAANTILFSPITLRSFDCFQAERSINKTHARRYFQRCEERQTQC